AHIDWLGEQEQAACQRLKQAQQALARAEQALAEAMQAFFRARAREDALEQRKGVWKGEVIALEARREEDAVADLVQAAHVARTDTGGARPGAWTTAAHRRSRTARSRMPSRPMAIVPPTGRARRRRRNRLTASAS